VLRTFDNSSDKEGIKHLHVGDAQRIVTSSASVRVGVAVPQRSGCQRYWKACGRVC
jgi:hypothetical protein